jgi:hypothetical protein
MPGHTRVSLHFVRARRIITALIEAICVGGPMVEAFDRWDHTLQDGNDTEADVVIVALCVGLAFSVAKLRVRFSVINLTNREALYNFLSTFSGTHFVTPRAYQVNVGVTF